MGRAWRTALESLTKWREGKSVRGILRENTKVRDGSHDAIERGRMCAGSPGKFLRTLRAIREMISWLSLKKSLEQANKLVCGRRR